MLLLCALIVGSGTMWAEDVLTLDCATPAPTGSTSTALSSTSDVATFLNSAAGLSSAENKITCSVKTGDIYKGKGSGGGNIPQQCLKVGKASGGGSFTFTIPNNYDEIDEVKMTCYGWKTSSSISVNGGTAQTFTTAQAVTTKTFELSSSSRTIAIAVTSSAVCITEIVLKKSGGSTTFKVTYNGNDATSGNVPVDNNEYAANAEVTVLGNTGDLAKTGCAFDGWNTQANGGGTNYDADDTFTISANTTLYAKWTPYTITAQSNNESYGTVTLSGNEITGSPNSGYRYANPAYTVAPENSATVVQDGNTFTVTPTANTTITINFEAIPTHTATFSVNGTTTTTDFQEGAAIEFPEVSNIDGMTFLGWTSNEINGTTDTAPEFVDVTSATMGTESINYYAVFALLVAPGTTSTVTDELTYDVIGVKGTNYSPWSNLTVTSDAIYAGNSAGGNSAIQLRTKDSNSGIVTTTSGGKLKKVTVKWNGNTANDRTLDIYGKNTPYTEVSNLYGANTQGTKIGSIVCGTSTELTISDDYTFIGLRSNSGAMYLDKITIEWETGSTPDTYSDYCTTIPAMLTVTIAEACTDGSKYYGTFSSSSAFKVPANVTVSEIGIDAEGKMDVHNYDSGDVVPANTGVMVSATTFGEHKLIISSEEGTPIPDFTNALRPSGDNGISANDMGTKDPNCLYYRLTMHNDTQIGFWWGNENGTAFAVGSNKAYMAVPTSVAGARNGFAFGDDATGISNVNINLNDNDNCYDLQGRKVNKPGKGLYIVNGKKVVIK